MLLGWNKHLATHVTALLFGSQLVLEVHAGGTGTQHPFHEFVDVQRAPEAGFGVSHDRDHPIPKHLALILGPFDLVGAAKGVVQALNDGRYRVGRVETLVRVDLTGQVGVTGYLPAG